MTTPDLAEQKKRYQKIYDAAFEVGRKAISDNFPHNEHLQVIASQRMTAVFLDALKSPQGAESFGDQDKLQEYINTGIGSAAISFYGLKRDANPLAVSLALHTIREKIDSSTLAAQQRISVILLDKEKMALLLGEINSNTPTTQATYQRKTTAQAYLMISLRRNIDIALAKAGFDPLPSMQPDQIKR